MDNLLNKIKSGEGIDVEFKTSKINISSDVYETVCAFANRFGGDIFLGVDDKGRIIGIDKKYIIKMKKEFITTINNSNKFQPPYYFAIREIEVEEKMILHILIPESSQVHRLNGKIFDRNEDADINITDNTILVTEMYIRKQKKYFENQVYPYLMEEDLRKDLIAKARKRAVIERADHPWKNLNDFELLRSAGMYLKDYSTSKEGFTLASVLVFGKDDTIRSVLPYYRIDAILRRVNIDRYDDRDDIRTNLIDSYDRMVAFIHKHLPDKFHLEGIYRMS